MTSELYDNIDSNDLDSAKEYARLYQPNLTRTRQIYKGTRDSEKVNLEINQIRFDILYLDAQINALKALQTDVYGSLTDGFAPGGDSYPNLDAAAEYYSELTDSDAFTVGSFDDIIADILDIIVRIRNLINFEG